MTRRQVCRRGVEAAVLGAVAAWLPLGPAHAQQATPPAQEVFVIDGGGGGRDFDTRTLRRGFNLFGLADAAHSGMRATGNFGSSITNFGDCHGTTLYNCQNTRVRARGTTFAPYFEVEWAFGVPPSEFVKIRGVAPSVSNASGGGWSAAYSQVVVGRPLRFGPHDGTLGRMFSGTTATTDGSCRDHTGFANGTTLGGVTKAGLQILPTSDCAETWGSEGWTGAHPIDAEGFKQLFDLQGDGFTFDFWKVPEQFQRVDKQFMGSRHHTYGETSDYNTTVLTNYGSVVPGGSGAPVYQGYPLGLLLHFEAFNFAVPTVAGAYFVQVTIVNNSEELWGAPIDYDSLYLGFSMGGLFSGQNHSAYALPDRGAVVYHNSGHLGAAGPCGNPNSAPSPMGFNCNSGLTSGYQSGATGIFFLKSPLGDLRHKLFTRTTAGAPCTPGVDPFCNPNHPLRGDTITFNRQAFGDFGNAEAFTWAAGMRSAFGYMSATEENTIAGRNPGDFSDRVLFGTFRSEDWRSGVKVHHNKFVPPVLDGNVWDYNKDGTPDTLALDTCGRNGCVVASGDTLANGYINSRGNIGGLQSFGPFRLAAGDTTSLIYAHMGESDFTQFWSTFNAVEDLYLNFYLAPESPPAAAVVSTIVTPGTNAFGTANPVVAITFSDAPARWVDPFLMKVADDIEAAPDSTPLGDLRDLNPGLPDLVRERAADNLERIEVYKSCNGGTTFTTGGDCVQDPATTVTGAADGFGWQAYAILNPDASGNIPTAFTDQNVDGGRSYLYVFVAKSRGANFLLNTTSGPDSVVFAPSIRNPLSRSTSDPNVVSVYVPASRPAGYQAASVAYTNFPTATVPFDLALSDNVVTSSYRAVFGNEILVQRDSSIADGAAFQSVVTVRRRATVNVGDVATDSIIRAESFTYASPEVFLVAGAGTEQAPVTDNGVVHTTTLYAALGFVLVGTNGPVFGSTQLTASGTTPTALLGRADFPGFLVTANNSVAGTHNANAEAQVRGPQSISELGLLPSDTIVPRGTLVNPFMVQWREPSSTATADGRGLYVITWSGDPFGLDRGFVLNLQNPTATEAEVRATLAARPVATTGLTDVETATLLNLEQGDLVPVKLPFTVRNVTFDRPVDVVMARRLSNRFLLGSGNDTLSVVIDEDQWVPGDVLRFIEDVVEDSTTPAGLVLENGQPLQRTRRAQTFSAAVLGCNTIREPCNPVLQTSPGATGYNPMRDGDRTRFEYYAPFTATTEYGFNIIAPVTGEAITAITDSALALIRVVPNPFVIYSQYQTSANQGRLLFTNVPSRGTLRIYTISGQFVQQITWEPVDLVGDGDLFWNMQTREGIDVASGLYLWVLTAPSNPSNPGSAPNIQARGKFVIIRGDSR
jgi:hypothetical protein